MLQNVMHCLHFRDNQKRKMPNMSSSQPINLAAKYFLDDIESMARSATLLHKTIEAIEARHPVNNLKRGYLLENGFEAHEGLHSGRLNWEDFTAQAKVAQSHRIAERQRLAQEHAVRTKKAEALKATRLPIHEKRVQEYRKERELAERFGCGLIPPEDKSQAMRIWESINAGSPIKDLDLAWLETAGQTYWTPQLRQAHHRNIAQKLTQEWEKSGDPWKAVNACAQWRKARSPSEALNITETALKKDSLPKNTRSALCTTRGGALRDLHRFDEALKLGHEANQLTPKDFRPCTLLGALYIQMRQYQEGADWYRKAELFGAKPDIIDSELRSILNRAKPEDRKKLAAFLKEQDPTRYNWV